MEMEEKDTLRVIIAGAGIAGLATAIALERVSAIPNLNIQMWEQAPELLEIGASIALSPNVSPSLPSRPVADLSSGLRRECELWRDSACMKLSRMKWATEDQVGFHKSFGKVPIFVPIFMALLMAVAIGKPTGSFLLIPTPTFLILVTTRLVSTGVICIVLC